MDRAHVAKRVNRGSTLYPAAFPLALLFILFIYPLSVLLVRGLASSVDVSFWVDRTLWRVVGFTYLQAFLSALFAGLVGTIGAIFYTEHRFPGRRLFWRSSLVCFSLPPILVAAACLGYWSRLGWDGYGWPGILLAHAFFNYPIFLKSTGVALLEMDRSAELSALSLGASRLRTFFEITALKLVPAFRSSFLLAFLYCSMSFLIPLFIGGGPRFTTIEVAIYQAVKVELDLAMASRLAVLQLILCLAVYFIFLRRSRVALARGQGTGFPAIYRFSRESWNAVARMVYFVGLAFLVAGPMATLTLFGAKGLRSIDWSETLSTLKDTVLLAMTASAFSLLLALPLAHAARHASRPWARNGFAVMASLPLSVSSIVLSFSLFLAFPFLMAELRGSLLAIATIQALGVLPPIFRLLADGFDRVPEDWHRTAESLGAGIWRRFFLLELPAVRGSLTAAFLFGMAFSLGEVGAVLMFVSDGISTLPLEIYRLLAQYRFEQADGAGVLLLALTFAIHGLVGRFEE